MKFKNEDSPIDLWDNIKHTTNYIIGISQRGERTWKNISRDNDWKHLQHRKENNNQVPHSSILAWRIPGMEEPGGLPSMGSHRVGHDWSDLAARKHRNSRQDKPKEEHAETHSNQTDKN